MCKPEETSENQKGKIKKSFSGNIEYHYFDTRFSINRIMLFTPKQIECAYNLINEKPIFSTQDFDFQKQGNEIYYRSNECLRRTS